MRTTIRVPSRLSITVLQSANVRCYAERMEPTLDSRARRGRSFVAAVELAAAIGKKLDVWDVRLSDDVTGDAVLVTTTHPAGTEIAIPALRRHLYEGGLVILAGDPDNTMEIPRALSTVTFGAEIVAPTIDPIVGSRQMSAYGTATSKVRQLHLDGVRAVHGGRPLIVTESTSVAATVDVGRGRLVVLGDADLFADKNIARAENAAFLLDLLKADREIEPSDVLKFLPLPGRQVVGPSRHRPCEPSTGAEPRCEAHRSPAPGRHDRGCDG